MPLARNLLGLVALILVSACTSEPEKRPSVPKDLAQEKLIPQPASLTATGLSFELTDATDIYISGQQEQLRWLASYLTELFNPATNLGIEVKTDENLPESDFIHLVLTDTTDLGPEGYRLEIREEGIQLLAPQPAGLFYGIQTLRQLLPPAIEKAGQHSGPWRIATGTIVDEPTYGYRGAMLDVARHFFAVEDVKRFIDLLAMYKMNRLHLHLADDQGWRIEIKSWPKLTEIGGSTQVGGGEGGFYTQEQYADIVKYAQDRFVTIVPEIDMPGHTNAALASYPELNCDGKARKLYTGTEVGFSTLCTSKEITYEFIDDVIGELATMTPGEYIHIGGDESHVTPMKDYIPFINRVQQIVEAHGKKVIGWDEIAHAELQPNTVVQWWAKADNAKLGIAQGAKVLVSPANKAYLDMKYDSTTELGLKWAGYIEVDTAYLWDPATIAEGVGADNIIGIEAPLWSETVTNMDEIEYLVFPRLPGYAEIGWTPTDKRNWEDYKQRLGAQKQRLEALGIDFYASPFVPWADNTTPPDTLAN